jgi:uncharacterized protein YifE (UPF0438 family)
MYFFKKETKPIKMKERNVSKYLLKRQKKFQIYTLSQKFLQNEAKTNWAKISNSED